ncbi:hypothetical protein IQ247_02660 [Plectonema cf. radiosum LEGE 06105]|uniref:MotA/TolQ/ExbB proton channel domain-containing protein n=1 Tax=Plectonema cf. radiosum LEGE 06105 TaxID=945769 RepID=A0A8J7EWY5_9CYAN|nr:hypothetical protein [Plectonema radiosum]MBE9211626.1 hypothetical protein [Plectonema cf. radiosum LEGE 06105]
MNVADTWNIVWQDTPFHIAIAGVLVLALIYEIFITAKYLYSGWGKTPKAIKNLRNTRNQQFLSWKQEHLQTNEQREFVRNNDNKFIIKKYPTVLVRPVPRSPLRFVTALCTSIGVLGTFYGIQQGLQDINLGDISNSQQLMTSSIGLLVNMKTAFSTSLMGLGCGSLFTLVLFATDSLRQNRRNGLREKLDNLASFETAENHNQRLVEEIRELRQSLTNQQSPTAEEIGEAVGRSIAEQFTGLNQLTSEAIGKAVAQRMESPLGYIFKEQQRLRKQLEENQGHKVIEKLIQDLIVEVIEPVAQRLDESAELTRQASQAVENLHRELGGISQSLASSIQTIQNFQQETLGELENFANNLGQTLNQFQINTTTTFQQQTDTITAVGNQASGLMNSAKDSLLATLANIDQTLTATRETVQNDLTNFREEYQNNLQTFFERQNNLLEGTLGQQRDGLAEVVTNLNTVFADEYNRRRELAQQVNQSMSQVSEAARNINDVACAVGLNSSHSLVQQENIARELNQISRNLNQQVEGVKREYRELSNTFRESLTAWTNHFGESRETFFVQADSAMANVCSNLLQTAKVLVAANNNRNNGNGRNHNA